MVGVKGKGVGGRWGWEGNQGNVWEGAKGGRTTGVCKGKYGRTRGINLGSKVHNVPGGKGQAGGKVQGKAATNMSSKGKEPKGSKAAREGVGGRGKVGVRGIHNAKRHAHTQAE